MGYALLVFSIFIFSSTAAQSLDQLVNRIFDDGSDSARIMRLRNITEISGRKNPSENLAIHKKILEEARKRKDKVIEAYATAELGFYLNSGGDFKGGIEMVMDALRMAEDVGSRQVLGVVYVDLGHMYLGLAPDKAVEYYRKGLTESQAANNYDFVSPPLLYIGKIFMDKGNLDSARYHMQRAYEIAMSSKSEVMPPIILIQMSELYYRSGSKTTALGSLRDALQTSFAQKDNPTRSDAYLAIARFYQRENKHDSSIYYGRKAYETVKNDIAGFRIGSVDFLRKIYKSRNTDSASKYADIYYGLMDTLASFDIIQHAQVLAIDEEERQKKLDESKRQAIENRQRNIQYMAIAIGVVSLIVLFVVLSNSIILGPKTIQFSGILALLVLFEFINLLVHPFLESITNHSPILLLLTLVAIGALLVPLHHKIEKWVLLKMTEKNKRIQIERAKKVLLKYESEKD